MGWLDNIIGWISPEWGARREVWRQYMNEVRHYDAGDYSRLNSGWYASNQSAEVTDRYSRDTVRARARDLERNSDMMNSVVGPFVRNTVGSGYVLQSYMDDQDTAREIERLWKLWCKKQNCDVTGTQSFNQMLRMAVRRKKVDGGILFVKRYTDAGMVPFQLQIFEVDELDCNQLNTKEKGNRIVGGIEYNQYNRPVGYWFRQYALDGITMMEPIYVPAKDVIFYFSKRRPSQLREMSDMTQTITRIRDGNEFMTAVSVKQRIEACLSVFIKKSLPTSGLGRSQNAATGPRTSYDGKTLSNYCFNTDTSSYTMALSRSGDGRSVALINYNKNGEVLNTINTEHKADSISVYKGTAAILDGNVVYGYNQKGDLLYSANSGTGSKKVVLASDYTAYILSVNQIRFIDLDSVSSSDTAETSTQE